jgi:hypothetical protein
MQLLLLDIARLSNYVPPFLMHYRSFMLHYADNKKMTDAALVFPPLLHAVHDPNAKEKAY